MEILEQLDVTSWQGPFDVQPLDALETGKVLLAPRLAFELSAGERKFLSPACLDG